jgi:RimJ/RimL family protein N-acetyltransferase
MTAKSQFSKKSLKLVMPNPTHRACIGRITKNRSVMQWVANGKVWDDNRLNKFFKYCAREERQRPKERACHYHAIECEGRCVGVVGIQNIRYDISVKGRPGLRLFLDPRATCNGIGTMAICTALRRYWDIWPKKSVIIDVRDTNRPMLRVMDKLELPRKHGGPLRIHGAYYKRFCAAPGECYERFAVSALGF